ncbi:hypothetical protein JHK82_024228 [Glycine max]|nr:hypothetical protein JHK82_024228 [Glycine max]
MKDIDPHQKERSVDERSDFHTEESDDSNNSDGSIDDERDVPAKPEPRAKRASLDF